MTPSVAIIVPVLRRPQRVAPLLESIRSTTPTAHVVFVTDPGDRAEEQAIDAEGAERITIAGNYARKINAGYRVTTEPLIFTGADDLLFHPGWLEAAVSRLTPGIGVVGTNDMGSPRVMDGEHATHSLVTRSYADDFGTIDQRGAILHEGYPHEFVDDELVATAKHRNAWAFAADSRVEHLHPNWGKSPTDALYRQQRHRMRRGRVIFQRRQPLWT